jgi:hypothetical protein
MERSGIPTNGIKEQDRRTGIEVNALAEPEAPLTLQFFETHVNSRGR